MSRILQLAILSSALLTAAGCGPFTFTHKYGDATLLDNEGGLFESMDYVRLPRFTTREPGRHVFHVKDIPRAVYGWRLHFIDTRPDAATHYGNVVGHTGGYYVHPHLGIAIRMTIRKDGIVVHTLRVTSDTDRAVPAAHDEAAMGYAFESAIGTEAGAFEVIVDVERGTAGPKDEGYLAAWTHY